MSWLNSRRLFDRPSVNGGKLMSSEDPAIRGRVYYVKNNRRHWVPDPEHWQVYGWAWPEFVAAEKLLSIPLAGSVPYPWNERAWKNPPRIDFLIMREVAASRLNGVGVEFGPGAAPFPAPLRCEVKYADFLPLDELKSRVYPGQTDFAIPEFHTGLEQMEGIAEGSLDFIIACHVIEHTHSPLLAFERAYRCLKPGGYFVLVVPDMRLTFDKHRECTTLEHIIEDYENWFPERDYLHYVEFYTKAILVSIDQVYRRVADAARDKQDIHFHTWTYESFGAMVEYSRQRISPWSEVWSQPAASGPDAIEFYYTMRK